MRSARRRDLEPLLGHLADDPDPESRAGEGLAPDNLLGKAELEPDGTHLVLEERPQRLDEVEVEIIRKAADVVVALDVRRTLAAAGLDDVGIERPLDKEAGLGRPSVPLDDVASGGLELPDERRADRLALLLWVREPRERVEEARLRVAHDEPDPRRRDEVPLDLLGLSRPKKAVVDEHAGQLVADRALHERRRDGGVDARRSTRR